MTLQRFLQHARIAGVDLDELRLAESLAATDLPFSLAKWQIKLKRNSSTCKWHRFISSATEKARLLHLPVAASDEDVEVGAEPGERGGSGPWIPRRGRCHRGPRPSMSTRPVIQGLLLRSSAGLGQCPWSRRVLTWPRR